MSVVMEAKEYHYFSRAESGDIVESITSKEFEGCYYCLFDTVFNKEKEFNYKGEGFIIRFYIRSLDYKVLFDYIDKNLKSLIYDSLVKGNLKIKQIEFKANE